MNQIVLDCINLIDTGQPILVSFKCFKSIYSVDKGGVVPIPKLNEKVVGGHAVSIIGYTIECALFMFVNTWGNQWGDGGHGYLPFYYFENNLIYEIYTFKY